MGKRIDLELLKEPSGLRFSINTKDHPAGGNGPIYIKNILPKGVAVDDGRLRPGNRLLQVNDIEISGKTQPEAVDLSRQCPTGPIVKILMSRQEDLYTKEVLAEEKESHLFRHERNIDKNHHLLDMSIESGKSSPEEIKRSPQPKPVPYKIQKSSRAPHESQIFPWRLREILTFDIPIRIHDTEKAGLGVSVKGKTSPNQSNGS